MEIRNTKFNIFSGPKSRPFIMLQTNVKRKYDSVIDCVQYFNVGSWKFSLIFHENDI